MCENTAYLVGQLHACEALDVCAAPRRVHVSVPHIEGPDASNDGGEFGDQHEEQREAEADLRCEALAADLVHGDHGGGLAVGVERGGVRGKGDGSYTCHGGFDQGNGGGVACVK